MLLKFCTLKLMQTICIIFFKNFKIGQILVFMGCSSTLLKRLQCIANLCKKLHKRRLSAKFYAKSKKASCGNAKYRLKADI